MALVSSVDEAAEKKRLKLKLTKALEKKHQTGIKRLQDEVSAAQQAGQQSNVAMAIALDYLNSHHESAAAESLLEWKSRLRSQEAETSSERNTAVALEEQCAQWERQLLSQKSAASESTLEWESRLRSQEAEIFSRKNSAVALEEQCAQLQLRSTQFSSEMSILKRGRAADEMNARETASLHENQLSLARAEVAAKESSAARMHTEALGELADERAKAKAVLDEFRTFQLRSAEISAELSNLEYGRATDETKCNAALAESRAFQQEMQNFRQEMRAHGMIHSSECEEEYRLQLRCEQEIKELDTAKQKHLAAQKSLAETRAEAQAEWEEAAVARQRHVAGWKESVAVRTRRTASRFDEAFEEEHAHFALEEAELRKMFLAEVERAQAEATDSKEAAARDRLVLIHEYAAQLGEAHEQLAGAVGRAESEQEQCAVLEEQHEIDRQLVRDHASWHSGQMAKLEESMHREEISKAEVHAVALAAAEEAHKEVFRDSERHRERCISLENQFSVEMGEFAACHRREIEELREAVGAEYVDRIEAHEEQLEQMARAHEQVLESIAAAEIEHNVRFEHSSEEHALQLEACVSKEAQAVAELHQENALQLEACAFRETQAVAELHQEDSLQLEACASREAEAVAELHQEHALQLEEYKSREARRVAELLEAHASREAQAVAELDQEHSFQLEAHKAHLTEIAAAKLHGDELHEAAMKEMSAANSSELRRLEANGRGKLEAALAVHSEMREEEEEEHAEARRRAAQQHQQALYDLAAGHNEFVARLKSEQREKQIAALAKVGEQHKAALAKVEAAVATRDVMREEEEEEHA